MGAERCPTSSVQGAEATHQWLERFQAVGRAQARYLWILLVVMVFYTALSFRTAPSPLKVPIVDLDLSGTVVLASGTAVLSFLVLAILGTMRALSRSRERLSLSSGADWTGEAIDIPNAIDLALYTTPQSPKIIATVAHFGNALFLVLSLVEAAWLWWRLVEARVATEAWGVFAVTGALLWLPAAWLVGSLLCRRIREVPTLWKTK